MVKPFSASIFFILFKLNFLCYNHLNYSNQPLLVLFQVYNVEVNFVLRFRVIVELGHPEQLPCSFTFTIPSL